MRVSIKFLLALLLLPGTAISANAEGARKVMKYEYDPSGRVVKTQSFDDVGVDATKFAETTIEYDRFNNVLVKKTKRVSYDRSAIYGQTEIVQRYAYEDSTWPTRPTKIYQPRYENQSDPDQFAAETYYDQTTGLPELTFSSAYYCTRDVASWKTARSFNVERSGSAQTIDIKNGSRCAVTSHEYDSLGRPAKTMVSQMLAWFDNTKAHRKDAAWIESAMEYYPIASVQRGALKRSWLGDETEANRRKTEYDWDSVGNLTSVTNHLGHTNSAEYDDLRRMVRSVGAEGEEGIYAYDPSGRLRAISQKIADGDWAVSRADYYADGRLQTVTDPDGDATNYEYDAAGRPDIVIDGEGRKTKSLYYPNGQVKCTIKAFDTSLQQAYASYEYGPDGQVARQRPAKGSDSDTCAKLNSDYDTVFTYDGFRRLFETTFPKKSDDDGKLNNGIPYASGSQLGSYHTYTRQWMNPNGQVYQTRTRLGDLIRTHNDVTGNVYQRDTLENRYRFTTAGGTGQQFLSEIRPNIAPDGAPPNYDIDHRRWIHQIPNWDGSIRYEQVREGQDPAGRRSDYAPYTHYYYDALGNMDRMRFYNGQDARYTYDKSNRMRKVSFSSDGVNYRSVANLFYDGLSRRTHHYLGDETSTHADGSPKSALQLYFWDADSDLKRLAVRWSSPGYADYDGNQYRYDQDGSGLLTAAYSNHSVWRQGPTQVQAISYPEANKLDQYEAIVTNGASQTISHDGAGNMESDGVNTYTYNSENQLIHAEGPGFEMEYWYDGLGRRSHSRDLLNTNPDGSPSEVFHKHAGQMEVGDYALTRDAVGKITNYESLSHVVLGAGVDERLAWHQTAGDELHFPMVNHQGSTVAVADKDGRLMSNASGGRFAYDAYGNDLMGAPLSGIPYRYTGRRLDAQTGLYYYRARYYDPKIGRFLQTDPIGTADQMNLYAYVGNNPINASDPSGEAGIWGFVGGFAWDVGVQVLWEGKRLREVNFTRSLLTGATAAAGFGMLAQYSKGGKAYNSMKSANKRLKAAERSRLNAQIKGKGRKKTDNAQRQLDSANKEATRVTDRLRLDTLTAGAVMGGAQALKDLLPELSYESLLAMENQELSVFQQALGDGEMTVGEYNEKRHEIYVRYNEFAENAAIGPAPDWWLVD